MSVITKRELEILLFISDGFSNKEIASRLNLSEETIKTHKKNLYRKFGVRNSAHLVRKASAGGYI